jgi:hypothetical protein
MVRILPIKETAERKKLLLTQSEIHRRTLQLQFALLQQSAGQVKKRFTIFGVSSLAVSLGASVAGLLVAKRNPGEKSGFVSRILSGVSFFNQVKGLFKRMKPPSDDFA